MFTVLLGLLLTVASFWLAAKVFCWLLEATVGRRIGHLGDALDMERQSALRTKSDTLLKP